VATLGPTPDQDRALSTLVERGTLTADQAAAVRGALWAPGERRASTVTSVLIEVAGYVGGGLMLGGATLLLALNWQRLTDIETMWILIGYALALVASGVLVAGGPRRVVGLREPSASPIRRRLVGVLLALSAAPASMAAGVAADANQALVAGLVGFAVAAIGYALLPTVPGLLMTVGMSVFAVAGALEMSDERAALLDVYAYVGLGLAWGVAAMVGLARPRPVGLALAATITIIGAQLGLDRPPVAYGLTLAVAVACFLLYWIERETVLLVFGVIAATIAIPEAVNHLTDDRLSGPAILLVSGAVLVAMSALGLWIRSARNGQSLPAGAV
jgi:hypothetical protein